jgi:threonine dehydratase
MTTTTVIQAPVTMVDVLAARRRIAPWIRRTPYITSSWLSNASGADVRLKLECLQVAHSFKSRGAFNAALTLREAQADGARAPRLVTASTGGHGRALSHASHALGFECIVFVPSNAASTKLTAIRALGADLRADAPNFDEAERRARAFAAEARNGAEYVSAYNDPRIVAATGSVALEVLEDDPEIDVLLVPLGGGGLISGVALAAKAVRPNIRVIGVEPAHNAFFHTKRAHGREAAVPLQPTLADALAGSTELDSITFPFVERLVDDIVLVTEAAIGAAVADLAAHEHIVVEGAGATVAAAITSKRVDVAGKKVAAIVTGSNIDRARFAALMAEHPSC